MPERKVKVLIPEKVITKGKWYQPYIHSVEENYTRARDKYYQTFDMDSAIGKAKKITKKLFPQLLAFYKGREAEFAKILRVPYSLDDRAENPEFAAKMVGFLADVEKITKGQMGPNDVYGQFSEMAKLDASNKKETETDLANLRANIKIMAKKGVKASEEESKRAVASVKLARRQKETETYHSLILNRMEIAARAAGVKKLPKQTMIEITNAVLSGQNIDPTLSQDVHKVFKKYKELNRGTQTIVGAVGESLKTTKKDGSVKKQTPQQQKATGMGFYHEDVIVDKIQQSLLVRGQEAAGFLANDFEKHFTVKGKLLKVTARGSGKENKLRQMQDGEIIIQRQKGEDDFVMGIDIKFSANDGKKYARGRNKKTVEELIPLFKSQKQAAQMMYFLANSFYHKDQTTYNDLVGTSSTGGAGKLFKLINMVRGLYGLIPASSVNFAKINDISKFVKDDKRFFVLVNQTAVLMTHFLKGVRGVVEAGERGEGTRIAGLKRSAGKDQLGLEDILNAMDQASEIRGGTSSGLYKEKLKQVQKGLGRKTKSNEDKPEIYSYLKTYLNRNVTNDTLKLK